MNPNQSNQLDLSNFAHITPSFSPEVSERSKSLMVIQGIMENLVNACQAYLAELKSFDDKAKYLDKREIHLKEYEYELGQREKKLFTLEDAVKQEKEYVEAANANIKKREEELLQNKNYLEEIEIASKAFEERKVEALKIESRVEDKMKMIDALNARQKELDEQQSIIERENIIDAERKRLLDIREERIKNIERRLLIDQKE